MSYIIIKNAVYLPQICENKIENLDEKEIIPNAMFRRKLTRLARIAICITDCMVEDKNIATVFGTAYSELKPACKILNNIQLSKRVMPIDFQNSVHNTAMSYSSIFYKNKQSIDTISCGDETSYKALWIAYVKLLANPELKKILVICVDAYDAEVHNIFDGFREDFCESGVAILLEKSDIAVSNILEIENSKLKLNGCLVDFIKGKIPSTDFMINVARAVDNESMELIFK